MAAATTKSTKRKSVDSTEPIPKKVKIAQSAERPQPKKSALKKTTDSEKPAKKSTADKKSSADVTKSASKTASTEIASDAVKPAKKSASSENKSAGSKTQDKPSSKPAKKSSKAAAAKIVEEETLEEEDGDEGEEATLSADRTAELLAGFDSSEDEDEDDDEGGIPLSKLPQAPISASLAKSLANATDGEASKSSGIVYIGRVPHGFFEKEMKAYFSQFGEINKLRLARSKKSGSSKHYAFIEFASSEVAEIVAKTMDKYLLFGHILQVRVVPAEQVKDLALQGAWKKHRAVPRNRLEGASLKKGTDKAGWEKRISRETAKRQAAAEKLKEIGYEFEMPKLKPVEAAATADQQLLQETEQADVEAEVADSVDVTELQKATKKRAAVNGAPEAKKSKKVKSKK